MSRLHSLGLKALWLGLSTLGLACADPAAALSAAESGPYAPEGMPSPRPTAAEPAQAATGSDPVRPDPDAWHFSGQILVRTEMDQRDFDPLTGPLFWTVMRTRLGVHKALFDQGLEFFMQVQDARTFGELGASIGNLKNLDLYQGYVQANRLAGQDLALQIGRFEMDYGNGRLFFPLPGWNYLGQSFDGGRLKYRSAGQLPLALDAFAVMIRPATPAIRNPTLAAYPVAEAAGHGLGGVWATANLAPEALIDAFGYYQLDQHQTTAGSPDISRWTFGLNHRGRYLDKLLSSSLEADYQTGQVGAQRVSAYLFSAALAVHPGPFHIGLGADWVSGNPAGSPTTNHAFAQPFGNNFAYYGHMDYFVNIPANTKGLGLNDYYLTGSWTPPDLPLEVALGLHHLTANQSAANGETVFGQEADLTVSYKFGPHKLIWGLSGFWPGGLFRSELFFGLQRQAPALWSYLQAIVNF